MRLITSTQYFFTQIELVLKVSIIAKQATDMPGISLQGSNSRTRDIELKPFDVQSNDRDETEETSHSEYTPISQISSRSPQNSNTIVGSSKQNFVSKIWGMIVDWYTGVSKTEVEAKLEEIRNCDNYNDCDNRLQELGELYHGEDSRFFWKTHNDGSQAYISAYAKLDNGNEVPISKSFEFKPVNNMEQGKDYIKFRENFVKNWLPTAEQSVQDKAGIALDVIALTPEHCYAKRTEAMEMICDLVKERGNRFSSAEIFTLYESNFGDNEKAITINICLSPKQNHLTKLTDPIKVDNENDEIVYTHDVRAKSKNFESITFTQLPSKNGAEGEIILVHSGVLGKG